MSGSSKQKGESMDISIQSQSLAENPEAGGITLEVKLDQQDIDKLKAEGMRALEIERSLPAEARTALADGDDDAYITDFLEMRATNDALEVRDIIPVAIPKVKSTEGLAKGEPFTCFVHVHIRPDIGLTSLEPVDLKTNRVAMPGFSQKAGLEGDENVKFLDDEKILRITMTDRLDTELPETSMRALGEEYTEKFERELAARGTDPDSYRATHQLDDEQYAIMMTRRALSIAHWNYVLDAVFVGNGYTITDDDLLASFEADFPGYSQQLLELHELRNDMYLTIEKVRRKKAYDWLTENALR